MIDDKKIEEAARYYCNNRYPASQDAPFIAEGFRHGAKWAINEFLKNLFHPAKDIPEEGRPVLVAYTHGGYSIEYWKAYNFSGQVNHWTLDITQWIYVDDLLPKEGGEDERA